MNTELLLTETGGHICASGGYLARLAEISDATYGEVIRSRNRLVRDSPDPGPTFFVVALLASLLDTPQHTIISPLHGVLRKGSK